MQNLHFLDQIKHLLMSKDKEASVSKYTGTTLQKYFLIFILGVFLHYGTMIGFLFLKHKFHTDTSKAHDGLELRKVKRENKTNAKKRNTSLNLFTGKYLCNVFSSIVIPEISEDWDENAEGEDFSDIEDIDDEQIIEVYDSK